MKKELKILYLVKNLGLGGAEKLVFNWCKSFHGNGFECCVLCIGEKQGPYVYELEKIGISVIELRQKNYNSLKFIYLYSKIIKTLGIDIVHSQCTWTLPQHSIGAKLGGAKKFILTIHNTYSLGNKWQLLRRKIAMLMSSLFIQNIIGVSNGVSTHSCKLLGVNRNRIKTILNGIDVSQYNFKKVNKKELRNKLGLPLESYLIVLVAGFSKQKDHITLLKSIKILKDKIPDMKLVLVGDGRHVETCKQFLINERMEDRVIFLGRRLDVPDILNASDVFAMSSIYEGLPLVLAEAQAANLPIVSTNANGVSEVVISNKTGFIVKKKDSYAIAKYIEFLFANPEIAEKMGGSGLENVLKNFNLLKMNQKYNELYLKR